MSARFPPPTLALKAHPPKYIYTSDADPSAPGGISESYKDLASNAARLQQIYDDVVAAYATNSRVLLLATWKAHLERFRIQFVDAGLAPMVLSVGMKRAETRAAVELIDVADPDKPLLVLGTGSFIGEGYDALKLGTLSRVTHLVQGTPCPIRTAHHKAFPQQKASMRPRLSG